MSRRDPLRIGDYLSHARQAIANIVDYTAGMDNSAFMGGDSEGLPPLAAAVQAAAESLPPGN